MKNECLNIHTSRCFSAALAVACLGLIVPYKCVVQLLFWAAAAFVLQYYYMVNCDPAFGVLFQLSQLVINKHNQPLVTTCKTQNYSMYSINGEVMPFQLLKS